MNERDLRLKLKQDFAFYAFYNLKITTKSGKQVRLKLNKAQMYLHKLVEQQKHKTGKIKAIILKGRQQGCSTYISGRIFHNITHNCGKRAFIMAHDADATENLFNMSRNFLDNSCKFLTPSCSQKSQRKIVFDELGSGYSIKTAGTGSAGRSMTNQYVHGSECAFWASSSNIASGLFQTVSDDVGSEIFLESTSNGIGNYFHTQWVLATEKQSEFLPVFIPWFWQSEYSKCLPTNFILSDEEKELKAKYNLTNENIYWRRNKISELSTDGTDGGWSFKMEYPNSATDAFTIGNTNSFIKHEHVISATQREAIGAGKLYLGVDPARFGDDKTCFIFRQGNKAFGLKLYAKKDNIEVAKIILKTLDKYKNIEQVFIDEGGLSAGVIDYLKYKEHGHKCTGINFANKPRDNKYLNVRAEIWGKMRQWLASGEAEIPKDNKLIRDLASVNYSYHIESRIKLESKADIKARTKESPDAGDALGLTFADIGYKLENYDF